MRAFSWGCNHPCRWLYRLLSNPRRLGSAARPNDPDVAAGVDPLLHDLQSGIHGNRSAFADGVGEHADIFDAKVKGGKVLRPPAAPAITGAFHRQFQRPK